MKNLIILPLIIFLLLSCIEEKSITTVFLAGDSTMDDYTSRKDYKTNFYPITGWGQVLQQFFISDSIKKLQNLLKTDSVKIENKAHAGRSTRTFFQEGRWRSIYNDLKPGDLVLIQFGHNDASEQKHLRYVGVTGYKEFLRLFVSQTRQKGATPILITPVNTNSKWEANECINAHKKYAPAMIEVADELNVLLIDLTELSRKLYSQIGKEYVTNNYFMNLPPDTYQAYPVGKRDNTHFQPEGALAIAQLVFDTMQQLKP